MWAENVSFRQEKTKKKIARGSVFLARLRYGAQPSKSSCPQLTKTSRFVIGFSIGQHTAAINRQQINSHYEYQIHSICYRMDLSELIKSYIISQSDLFKCGLSTKTSHNSFKMISWRNAKRSVRAFAKLSSNLIFFKQSDQRFCRDSVR